MFRLHGQLEKDAVPVCDLPLSSVLLFNDARFPWLILVPRIEGARELYSLDGDERVTLMEEIALASGVLQRTFEPYKLNVGALGNIVEQLHVHVIGRFKHDAAWPGPVWGFQGRQPYPPDALSGRLKTLQDAFEKDGRIR
ncbi:MAG: HIT domain-containing protein [Deltaproteobacteria bacterium]|nr:HIT domain-containing protein [Deltaproteobacteria bacterium]